MLFSRRFCRYAVKPCFVRKRLLVLYGYRGRVARFGIGLAINSKCNREERMAIVGCNYNEFLICLATLNY